MAGAITALSILQDRRSSLALADIPAAPFTWRVLIENEGRSRVPAAARIDHPPRMPDGAPDFVVPGSSEMMGSAKIFSDIQLCFPWA
jgi:hypothetical protein